MSRSCSALMQSSIKNTTKVETKECHKNDYSSSFPCCLIRNASLSSEQNQLAQVYERVAPRLTLAHVRRDLWGKDYCILDIEVTKGRLMK